MVKLFTIHHFIGLSNSKLQVVETARLAAAWHKCTCFNSELTHVLAAVLVLAGRNICRGQHITAYLLRWPMRALIEYD
jgi:hypothetical protein